MQKALIVSLTNENQSVVKPKVKKWKVKVYEYAKKLWLCH